MSLFKNKYRIESARLKGWDYSNPGAYFITICTKDMKNYFGDIEIDNKLYSIDEIRSLVKLNAAGKIVDEEWTNTPVIRNDVILDEFVIMPNHFHGIIFITKNWNIEHVGRDALSASPEIKNRPESFYKALGDTRSVSLQDFHKNKFGSQSNNLSSIVRGFKSACTSRIRSIGDNNFAWQSRFHEHIIRSEKSLNKIRDYIICNPIKWKFDKYYRK